MLSRMKARYLLSRATTLEGRDGWFFLSDQFEEEISYATGFKPAQPDAVQATLEAVIWLAQASRETGACFLFAPAPAKPGIVSEKLPPGLLSSSGNSFLSSLFLRMVPDDYIDLRPHLMQARTQAEPFSRLNSHWSDFGAFIAWRAIEARLALAGLPPAATPLTLRAIEEMDGFNEMEGMCGHVAPNNWTYPHFEEEFAHIVFELADGTPSPQLGRRAVQLGDMPIRVRNDAPQTQLRALVVGDSSAVSLSPYLCRHFASVRYVRHPLVGTPDETLTALRAEPHDVVLLANAERYCPRLGVTGFGNA